MTAVIYFLNGTDFHFENLLNHRGAYYAIDVETLFSSLPWNDAADGSGWRRWTFLSTDLLRARFGYEGAAADVSGLYANSAEAPFPIYRFEVTEDGALRLRIWRPGQDGESVREAINVPSLSEIRESQKTFVDAIPNAVQQARLVLPEALKQLSRNAICRFVMRPTLFYSRLFQRLYMPRFFEDAALFSVELNGVCAGLNGVPEERRAGMMALFDVEIEQMQRGDVPYFTYSPFASGLWADGKLVADGFFANTGFDCVAAKLAGHDEEDTREQIGLVRASEALGGFKWTDARRRESGLGERDLVEVGPNAIALCCRQMACDILAAARRLPNGRTRWIGHVGDAAAKSIVPHLSDDAYFGGYWGIMAFLTRWASVMRRADTADPKLEDFLTAEAEVRCHFTGFAPAARSVVGLDGVGGLMVAYLRLMESDPLRFSFLQERLAACLDSITPDRLQTDPVPDVIGGSAGLVLALALLVSHPTTSINAATRAQAKHAMALSVEAVLANAITQHGLTFWPSPLSRRGLIGFAHGNAGFVAALAQYLVVCDRAGVNLSCDQSKRITATLRQALDWDRAQRVGTCWPDLRPELGGNAPLNNSWCHGLAGLGLSRVALLRTAQFAGDENILRELSEIIAQLLAEPGQAIFDTPCCGAAGEWELLVSAGRLLRNKGWLEEGQKRASAAAARIVHNGGYRGFMGSATPFGLSPSLFQGAAGVGDTLLASQEPGLCNLYGLLTD